VDKPKRRLKRKAPFIIAGVVLLIALLAGGIYAGGKLIDPASDGVPSIVTSGKRINVLLLGIDAREGETMARSDSIIMASIDPRSKQISLLSIPRDTRVEIPGYGWDKINSASAYGGPELTMKVVSTLIGVPLKNYVMTNFSGFENIVDVLGGVTLDVEQDMYHEDETEGRTYEIDLSKGLQRLDGEKAIQYVRYRGYVQGDIDRTKHQQIFLTALAKEILQPSTIPKLPKLITEINKYVKTNMSTSEMVKTASTIKSIEEYKMVSQTLPGRNISIGDGSYWGVDPAEAKQLVVALFNGEVSAEIVLSTPLTGRYAPPEDTTAEDEKEEEALTADAKQQAGSKTGQSAIMPVPKTDKPGSTDSSSGTGSSGSTDSTTPMVIITPIDNDTRTTDKTSTGRSGTTKTGTSI
jgi:LCP family protein required for cell wall assembly